MFSIKRQHPASRKQLRSFGFVLAAGFLVIALWRVLFRDQEPRWWSLAISLTAALAGLLAPGVLRFPYRIWMLLGDCLGWVNSRIILGALFYIVVTPTRAIMAIVGHDPMNRKFDPDAETYRVIRKPRSAGHMNHQF